MVGVRQIEELWGRWARGKVREKEWGKKGANWWRSTSLSHHSFQGCNCVPLDDERSLVLSFPEPPLCRTVPLSPPLPLLSLPLSAVLSFSACSDPPSRWEFWREGVLDWRNSWPFFSSKERKWPENGKVKCDKRTQLVSKPGGRSNLTSQCLNWGLIVSTEELCLNGFHHSLESAARTWK